MQNPEKMIDVKGQEIKGDMFLIEANKYIFYAIDYLFSKRQDPTPITVVEVLKDRHARKTVEEFGGVEYLTLLTEQRINENSIEILCEKLKQSYTKKELCNICDNSKRDVYKRQALYLCHYKLKQIKSKESKKEKRL